MCCAAQRVGAGSARTASARTPASAGQTPIVNNRFSARRMVSASARKNAPSATMPGARPRLFARLRGVVIGATITLFSASRGLSATAKPRQGAPNTARAVCSASALSALARLGRTPIAAVPRGASGLGAAHASTTMTTSPAARAAPQTVKAARSARRWAAAGSRRGRAFVSVERRGAAGSSLGSTPKIRCCGDDYAIRAQLDTSIRY